MKEANAHQNKSKHPPMPARCSVALGKKRSNRKRTRAPLGKASPGEVRKQFSGLTEHKSYMLESDVAICNADGHTGSGGLSKIRNSPAHGDQDLCEKTEGDTVTGINSVMPSKQSQAENILNPRIMPGCASFPPTLKDLCTAYQSQNRRSPRKTPVAKMETIQDIGPNAHPQTDDGPRVRVVDGEIVLEESSMIVGARRSVEEVDREFLAQENSVIVEEESLGVGCIAASYSSFLQNEDPTGRRKNPQHWSFDETRLFYHLLRQCGTDFSTMEALYSGLHEALEEKRICVANGTEVSSGNSKGSNKADGNGNVRAYPSRTRKQLKKKYQDELRKNPILVDLALDPEVQLPLDTNALGDNIVIPKKKPIILRSKASSEDTNNQPSKAEINHGESLHRLTHPSTSPVTEGFHQPCMVSEFSEVDATLGYADNDEGRGPENISMEPPLAPIQSKKRGNANKKPKFRVKYKGSSRAKK